MKRYQVCGAVGLVAGTLLFFGCGDAKPPLPLQPTPPSPTTTSLSGQVFDVTSAGRFPIANVNVLVVVAEPTGGGSTTYRYVNTSTGPDGRYLFPQLPHGVAVVHAHSEGRRQVCGALTTLSANTQQDLEVTTTANPQRSPVPAPLTVTGEIYEATPAGRVGLGGAVIYLEWAFESNFLTVVADAEGRYQACGIPASRPMKFEVFRSVSEGYDSECANYIWGWDFGTAPTRDIELKPGKCQGP